MWLSGESETRTQSTTAIEVGYEPTYITEIRVDKSTQAAKPFYDQDRNPIQNVCPCVQIISLISLSTTLFLIIIYEKGFYSLNLI